MAKRFPSNQESSHRPTDSQVRASAGRIVDTLQQLVLTRPEMILALEAVLKEFLAQRHIGIVTQNGEPDLLALLEPPAGERITRTRRAKRGDKQTR